MESLITLSRNVLQRIGAVNARLLDIIRIAYEQLVALFAWPAMRNQHIARLQISPRDVSPSCETQESDQDKHGQPDEPEDESIIMKREADAADQKLRDKIEAWKQSEKNLMDALLAGKRYTFTAHDEVQDLKDANNKAEDEMIDEIRDRTKLHMQHCEVCDRKVKEFLASQKLARKVADEKRTPEVQDPPRKLLAITYGDDKADEVIPHKLSRPPRWSLVGSSNTTEIPSP
ncbi:hypothetical protein CBL_14613 [Carabus blaptoides fortunei]